MKKIISIMLAFILIFSAISVSVTAADLCTNGKEHEWSALTVVPASCNEKEYQTKECARCHQVYKKYTSGSEALGHLEDIRNNGDGTHTVYCKRANCKFNETKPCSMAKPICGQVSVCDICKNSFGVASAHQFDKTTADGKCTVCSAVCSHSDNQVEPIPEVKATCTTDGSKNGFKCADCGKIVIAPKKVEALGHDIEIINGVAPTCTAAGKSNGQKCKREGCTYQVEQVALDALGHSWSSTKQVIKDATCTTKGSRAIVCTRSGCGAIKEGTIEEAPMNEHDWEVTKTVTKVATCEIDGEKAVLCKNCKAKKSGSIEIIHKLGHDWGLDDKEPATCVTDGCSFYICQREFCNSNYKEIIPATGVHEIVSWNEKEPTCTKEGLIRYECDYCDYSYSETERALGHSYPDNWSVILAPDCQTKGASIKVCLRCNDVISQTLPKTGHVDSNNDQKCDTCDKTIAVVEPEKEPEEKPCDCDCHAGGIKAFFFNFLNFFAKIFDKSKRVCACGAAH